MKFVLYIYKCIRWGYYHCYINLYNYLILRLRNVEFDHNLRINGKINLYGKGKIVIGRNVTINSDMDFNPIGGMNGVIINTSENGYVKIGDGVGISNSAIVSYCSIEIENDVFIGGNSVIYDTDFHSLKFVKRIANLDDDIKSKPIKIKRGAFIGGSSIILKGVTIGQQSIVGAGSVVTHDIPDGEVWAGNPAKFIRKISMSS